jgi:outer membrane lipoprotein SlyB
MSATVLTGTRGQATPLWAVVLLLAALLLVPMGLVARATIERSKAQSAADAAALAGALDGEDEARTVARLNGARVERYHQEGDTVEVVVVVGDRRATARALREEVPLSPP